MNTIARSCSSAAAITSSSRTDPPGLNDGGRPCRRHGVQTIAEREERVRRRDRSAQQLGARARRFHAGQMDGIHAAHLSGANRQRPIGGRENHRVRLDVCADAPRKSQRLPFLRRRLPFRHDLQLTIGQRVRRLGHAVAALLDDGANERSDIAIDLRNLAEVRRHHPQVWLGGQDARARLRRRRAR